jgi:hypothetical protein
METSDEKATYQVKQSGVYDHDGEVEVSATHGIVFRTQCEVT